MDEALDCHQAGEWAKAEAAYRHILQANPDHPDALNLLGALLQDRGRDRESLAALERAVTLEPDFAEALANLARLQQMVVVTQETRILKAPFSQAYQQAVLCRQRLTLRAFPLICTAQAGSMCRQKVGLPWVQQPCSMSGGHARPIASS